MRHEYVSLFPVFDLCSRRIAAKHWAEYEACIKRVENDTTGEAHCTGQYLDFWACIDKCVRVSHPPLFHYAWCDIGPGD